MLAWMFVAQMGIATGLGVVLVKGLDGGEPGVLISEAPQAGATDGGTTGDGATPGPSSAPTTAASEAGGGGDTTTGGSGDTGSTTGEPTTTTGGATPTPGASGQPTSGPVEGTRIGVTDDTIKVGTLVTQTGAINFRSSAQASRAYIDMINEQGGVHGRRIEMILRDDGLDENKGQQAIEELVNAGVFSFMSFNAPLSEQSVLPVLEQYQIPLVGAFAIPPHDLGWVFSAPYETYGRVGGAMLCELGVTTPGLVYLSNEDQATDDVIVNSWKAGLETCGVTMSDENIFGVDVTNPDYTDVVTQWRFGQVDGIGSILEGTNMVRLQSSMNRQAFSPTHVSSPFGGDPSVLNDKNVGASFEGLYVLSGVEFLGSSSPMIQQYEAQVKRRFGDDAQLNWAGQHGWLGTHIFVEMLKRIGPDPTREALIDAVNHLTDFETGMTVPLTVTTDKNTHVTNNHCMKVGKVVDAKVQPIKDWTCPPLTMVTEGGAA